MSKIAVIIPFYQKSKGILARAVESALLQEGVSSLRIVVVDDESPVSAKSELEGIIATSAASIDIIEQGNAGPGAARNRGLDYIDSDTEYVAFLDSDDVWERHHLLNAKNTLDQGYDVYFSNYIPSDADIPYFEIRGLNFDGFQKLNNSDSEFDLGPVLFDKLLVKTDIAVGTSTVVYRFSKMEKVRFPISFSIGEDTIFFMKLAVQSDRVAFSAKVDCVYGKGVNIFAGSGWHTPGMLRRASHSVFFRKYLSENFDLSESQEKIQSRMLSDYRVEFMRSLLHSIRHPSLLDFKVIFRHFSKDPISLRYLLPALLSSNSAP